MATLTITIPNNQVTLINDAIAANNGYTGFLADGITAQTKTEFSKAFLITDITQQVRIYKQNLGIAAAIQTANSETNSGVTLT